METLQQQIAVRNAGSRSTLFELLRLRYQRLRQRHRREADADQRTLSAWFDGHISQAAATAHVQRRIAARRRSIEAFERLVARAAAEGRLHAPVRSREVLRRPAGAPRRAQGAARLRLSHRASRISRRPAGATRRATAGGGDGDGPGSDPPSPSLASLWGKRPRRAAELLADLAGADLSGAEGEVRHG